MPENQVRFNARRLLIETLCIVAVVETGVMLFLPFASPYLGVVPSGLIDTGMVLMLTTPLLYWRFTTAMPGPAPVAATGAGKWASTSSAVALATLTQIMGLAATGMGVWWQVESLQAQSKARFEVGTDRTEAEIVQRLNRTLYGLRGAHGAIAANENMRRKDFRAYVESRNLANEFPGIRGFGLIRRVQRSELDRYVADQRADGAPGYTVHTSGDLPDLYLVENIEPIASNGVAMGFDLGQDPRRRAALEYAAATGEPTLLAKVELLQDSKRTPGFIYFLPVYKPGTHPQTAEERVRDLQCFVYAPIVAHELLASVVTVTDRQVDFELFDGNEALPEMAIFDTTDLVSSGSSRVLQADPIEHRFLSDRYMNQGSRSLLLRTTSTTHFEAAQDKTSVLLMAAGGLLVSLLLTVAVWLLAIGRQRAQEAAQAMTEELRQLAQVVEHTGNAVTIMDRELKIVWVNTGFTAITGYSRDEAIGKMPSELLTSERCDPTSLQTLIGAARRGEACRVEIINRTKDGRDYWADTEVQPTFNTRNELVGFMEIGTDITAQKQLQHALEFALRDAGTLLNTIHTHAIVSTADQHGTITEVNDAFCRISGYSREELIGRDHRIVNSGAHSHAFWGEFWETVTSGKPWHGEICNRAKDGSLYWVDSMVAPYVGSDGLVEKFVSIRTDITSRKLNERALVDARQKAEEAAVSKGQFLANMSHEIRTPMNAIIGMTSMLLDSDMNPSQRDYLQKVHNSANSLLRILNDILDFSKMSAGQLHMEELPFDLSASVGKVIDLFALPLQNKALGWSLQVAPDVPERLLGDALRLEQILINLLGNAVKFTAQGSIGLRIAVVQRAHDSVRLEFAVHDSGIGMDAQQCQRLFTPFTQADSSITRKYGGTGLGLSITKQLVEMMGGHIAVHSAPQQGSTFRFTLNFALDAAHHAGSAQVALQTPAIPGIDTTGVPKPPALAGNTIVQDVTGAPARAVDWAQAQPLLSELAQLLGSRNLRAKKVAEALEQQLAQTAWETAFKAVLDAVRQLDFESALVALQGLQPPDLPEPI